MVRICGYIVNPKKKVYIALSSIYGVGHSKAKEICKALKIDYNVKLETIDYEGIYCINTYIVENCTIGEDLKKMVNKNKMNLYKTNSFRGKRLFKGLPCRGQRTRSNRKTAKKFNKIVLV